MQKKPQCFIMGMAVSVLLVAGCDSGPVISYKKDVMPVLAKYCAECHTAQGEGLKKSGFDIGSHGSLMKGTQYGPVVVAGDAASSSLYRLVAGKVDKSIQMPHGKNPLTPAEITQIEKWIDQGAKDN